MALLKARATQDPVPAAPERAAGRLMAELEAADAATRRMAARDLGHHPEAVAAIAAALAVETDHSVLEALVGALGRIATPEAVAALLAHLRSEDAWLRNAVVLALQDIGPAAALALRPMLDDPDPDVRIAALVALGGVRCPEAEGWIAALLDNEADINVCAGAIETLGQIGGPASVPALDRAAARFATEPFLSFAATAVRHRLAAGGLT